MDSHPEQARRTSSKTTRWIAVATLAVAGIAGIVVTRSRSGGASPAVITPAAERSPHQRMVATLAAYAAKAKKRNGFVGQNDIEQLRMQAQALASQDTAAAVGAFIALGNDEMRLGHPDAAVAALSHARDVARKSGDPALETTATYGLGVAQMRLAESQNCVARHTSQSCVFPIQGSGVHVNQEGGRAAMADFEAVLAARPTDLSSRWLLNVAAMTVGEWPQGVPKAFLITPESLASREDFPRFTDVAPRLGLNTFDLAGGAIVDDLDGDGLFDVLVSTMDPSGPMHEFHDVGDGGFVDRSREAGLDGITGGLDMVDADYDGDGDLDVLVMRGAWLGEQGRVPVSLLRNDGHGNFADVTYEAGLATMAAPTQCGAWADYDNDGDLDLFLGHEKGDEPFASQLFRNDGKGTFTDVAFDAGVTNMRFAKGAAWGDYDGDGWMDLYVTNLGEGNRLYRNEHDGTFRDVAEQAGVLGPEESFACWFWDFDNDGALDIFAASYPSGPGPDRVAAATASLLGLPHSSELSALYKGDGHGGFTNVGKAMGLTRAAWPMGANFGDLDNDGWLDMYLGTGAPQYETIIPNVMYHNREGRSFTDVTTAGGFGHLQKGHGVAFADLDGDGDQDVFEQMGGAFAGDGFGNVLYENPGFGNHWLDVKLEGVKANRSAIGARIRATFVDGGATRSVVRWVGSGGSFGCNPLRQHLGLGQATQADLEITWPGSGDVQSFRAIAADRAVRIVEGDAPVEMPVASFRFK